MNAPRFDGATFDSALDAQRLTTQLNRVQAFMLKGEWHTLSEIAAAVSYPPYERATEASVSARLRDLRKERFGSFKVERRRRGAPRAGLFEYRVLPK